MALRAASFELQGLPRSLDPGSQLVSTDSDLQDTDDWGNHTTYRQTYGENGHGDRIGPICLRTRWSWFICVGLMTLLLSGCEIGLTISSRITTWSIYLEGNSTAETRLLYILSFPHEFPYPLTTIWIQLVAGHLFLHLSTYVARRNGGWFRRAVIEDVLVSSNTTLASGGRESEEWPQEHSARSSKGSCLHSCGISASGVFEFQVPIVKQVFPLASLLAVKLWLSSLAMGYSPFSNRGLASVTSVLLSALLTFLLRRMRYSFHLILPIVIAILSLLASMRHPKIQHMRQALPVDIITGLLAALYPMQILRTCKILLASNSSQTTALGVKPAHHDMPFDSSSGKELRAFWQVLHYTSIITILIFTFVILISGEAFRMWHNAAALSTFFYWFMVLLGGLCRGVVLLCTIAVTRATSPLMTTLLSVFQTSLLLPILMSKDRLGIHNWVALAICWTSCSWVVCWSIGEGGRRRNPG